MASPKFRDVSTGSKSLVLLELLIFAGALVSTIYLNGKLNFVEHKEIPTNVIVIYALVFSLIVQLSSLALGLYNSKLRESFRGILRRVLVSVAIGFFIVTIINPFYGENALPIELLAIASFISFFEVGILRAITFKVDFFGFNILINLRTSSKL